MRIKFVKVEETLETRGKKATGKVSRAATGHVVTPRGGQVGVDDDPNNPTKKLKAMVRRSYKAKAQNSSTEILGNKIVEEFNKLFQEATISKSRGSGKGEIVKDVKLSPGARKAMEKRGKKVPGGYSVPSKGKRLPTEIAEAKAQGVLDAAKKRDGAFTMTSYNPRAHDNDEVTYVPGKRSRTTVAKVKGGAIVGYEGKKGYRTRKVNASTEILGDKIEEGLRRRMRVQAAMDRKLMGNKSQVNPDDPNLQEPGANTPEGSQIYTPAERRNINAKAAERYRRDTSAEERRSERIRQRIAQGGQGLRRMAAGAQRGEKNQLEKNKTPEELAKIKADRAEVGGNRKISPMDVLNQSRGLAARSSLKAGSARSEYRMLRQKQRDEARDRKNLPRKDAYSSRELPPRPDYAQKRDSLEIFGNKIVEEFDNLLSELSTKTLKSYQGKAIAQMRQGKKSGLSPQKMAKRGKMIHKAGEKIKAQSGDQKPGQFKRSEEEKLTGKPKIDLTGNKTRAERREESLDYTHNDRFDEISDELVKRAEKAARKKDKEHSKISSDARKVGAKDTAIDHRIISDAKGTQARRFRQRLAGDRQRPTNPDSYRARRRANREYHQAKKNVGIGTRTVPVARR